MQTVVGHTTHTDAHTLEFIVYIPEKQSNDTPINYINYYLYPNESKYMKTK